MWVFAIVSVVGPGSVGCNTLVYVIHIEIQILAGFLVYNIEGRIWRCSLGG
jgi:hypothetical protein